MAEKSLKEEMNDAKKINFEKEEDRTNLSNKEE